MEKSKNKGLIVLVILLAIGLVGSVGYIVYDKVLNKSVQVEKVKKQKSVTEEDITNTELSKKLHDKLLTNDHTHGLYFDSKVTVNDNNNFDFISFEMKNYIIEKGIDLENSGKVGGILDTITNEDQSFFINKEDFNSYMNKKYNNSLKYDLPIFNKNNYDNENYIFQGNFDLISFDQDKWAITAFARAGGEDYIDSKIVKVVKNKNYVYLYDKPVFCYASSGEVGCSYGLTTSITEKSIINCSNYDNDKVFCPNINYNNLKTLSEYGLNNMSDKLNTYKHTFKKGSDGEYRWYSSEIIKNNK